MKKNQLPVLGIDLGGTKISAAIIQDNQVKGEITKVPTPKGPENIINELLVLIEKAKQDHLILGVGIATAGIVNPATGEIVGSTGNLPGWEGTPLAKVIQAKTALRVHVENDANAAAFGEVCASEKLQNKKCVVAITLGTGIGSGIVLDGKVYRGAHFAAAECGHIKISMENKRRCTCGLWDCWEAYGAGRGLVATGYEMLENVSPNQTPLSAKRDKLTTEDIINAAKNGDIIGQKAMEKYHEHVACGMVSLAHTLDPDVFVVTGGMSKFIDFTMLHDMVADRTLPRVSERLEIHPSSLNQAAGMVGAAGLVQAAALEDDSRSMPAKL